MGPRSVRQESLPELIARRARVMGPTYRLFYKDPVQLVRGEGCWVFDTSGRRFLDMYNNVPIVGHCHPSVTEALARQARILNTNTRYLHASVVDLAERILSTMPHALGNVVFTCTGSEANDLAVRVARSVTGGTGVIVTENAYHGVTETLAGMSPSMGSGVACGRDVYLVPRPAAEMTSFADGVVAALDRMRADGVKPAAMIVDTVFASDGIFADPPGFLSIAADVLRTSGALFIADEVQPGFGRTGSEMWCFARHGVTPDLVTMGKPMGNGHPVAAMAARSDLLARFSKRSGYFNTFGGNPVSAEVAHAVLNVIEKQSLMANALAMGTMLTQSLQMLAQTDGTIAEIRGAGLYLGVQLRVPGGDLDLTAHRARSIVNSLRHRGVLIGISGPGGTVLKLRPPLIITEEEVKIFLTALGETLAEHFDASELGAAGQ